MPSFTEPSTSAFFVMKRCVLSALSVLGRGLWMRRGFDAQAVGDCAGQGTLESAGGPAHSWTLRARGRAGAYGGAAAGLFSNNSLVPSGAGQDVGWVWRQPARPSAYGWLHGVRTSSQSGGLAEGSGELRVRWTPNTPNLRLKALGYSETSPGGVCKCSQGARASEPAAGGKHLTGDFSHAQALAEKGAATPAQQLKRNAALALFRGVLRARRPALRLLAQLKENAALALFRGVLRARRPALRLLAQLKGNAAIAVFRGVLRARRPALRPLAQLKRNAALALFRGVLRARRPALRQRGWSWAFPAVVFQHGLASVSMAGAVRLLAVAIFVGMLPACSTPGGGGAGLSAQDSPKTRYVRQVIEQVGKMWQIYRAQPPNYVAYGSLEVIFYVNKKGKVENIRVKNTPETNSDLMHFTVDAVQTATLPPMPRDVIPFLEAKDAGRLRISYTVNNSPPGHGGGAVPFQLPATVPAPAQAPASALGFDPGSAVPAPPPPLQQMMEKKVQEMKQQAAAQPRTAAPTGPKGRYTQQVLGVIEKKWHLYVHLAKEAVTYGESQIVFYVNQLGKVEGLRVVNEQKANPKLTEITLRAIKDAEIPPMPADVIPLLPTNDRGRLKIEYNALIY